MTSNWTHSIISSAWPQLDALGMLRESTTRFAIEPPEQCRSWCVIDRSKQTVVYIWPLNSPGLAHLFKCCEEHGFETLAPSWSRLSKHIWQKYIAESPSKIKPHPFSIKLATDKRHWHKIKSIPGFYENITEIDIKSAYAQSFANMPSAYMESPQRAANDFGAIERWIELFPRLDKKVRLALIGWLSSYELTTLSAGKERGQPLRRQVIRKTYDGGAFNSIHLALYNLYRILGDIEQIAPEFTPRLHTDSLWIDSRIPTIHLESMLNVIKCSGYKLSVKGHGQSQLYDLNSGAIGGKLIGIPPRTLEAYDKSKREFPGLHGRFVELDERLSHLPYRNERYSIKQARAIIKMRFPDSDSVEG